MLLFILELRKLLNISIPLSNNVLSFNLIKIYKKYLAYNLNISNGSLNTLDFFDFILDEIILG